METEQKPPKGDREPVQIVYIAGAGRSGSTLLARMLGQVPGVVSIGEARHFWRGRGGELSAEELCGCGTAFAECPFWTQVVERVFAFDAPVPFNEVFEIQQRVDRVRFLPQILSPLRTRSFRDAFHDYTTILERFYRAALDVGAGRILVDASKDISTLYLLSKMPWAELTILNLARDPRAVAYSWTKKKIRPERPETLTYMSRFPPYRVALGWDFRMLMTSICPGVRSRVRMRYEDLIRDPVTIFKETLPQLGLQMPDPSFIGRDWVTFSRPVHVSDGNPSRFAGERVPLRVDDAWKSKMPALQRWIVGSLTWPLRLIYSHSGERRQGDQGVGAK